VKAQRHVGDYYFLLVEPDHIGFWRSFRKQFDPNDQRALKFGARLSRGGFSLVCPEFPDIEKLISWLVDCTGEVTFWWAVLTGE